MRVLVIDDHPLIQEALGRVLLRLAQPVELTAVADCEAGLAAAARWPEPDLVLLDLQLPGLSGIDALRAWRSGWPTVPVIVLSSATDPQTMYQVLQDGAAGYIPKSTAGEVMLSAIRLVLEGGRYLPPELLAADARAAVPAAAQPLAPQPAVGLMTVRQLQVLQLIAEGAPNKVICRRLDIAERTVKAHLTQIFRTLNVASRTQAALAATRLGLLPRAGVEVNAPRPPSP
jgi:DNA-binding NarL/FixJ family response regulator